MRFTDIVNELNTNEDYIESKTMMEESEGDVLTFLLVNQTELKTWQDWFNGKPMSS